MVPTRALTSPAPIRLLGQARVRGDLVLKEGASRVASPLPGVVAIVRRLHEERGDRGPLTLDRSCRRHKAKAKKTTMLILCAHRVQGPAEAYKLAERSEIARKPKKGDLQKPSMALDRWRDKKKHTHKLILSPPCSPPRPGRRARPCPYPRLPAPARTVSKKAPR